MNLLVVMNYKQNQGGITGSIKELLKSLRKEGLCLDIISTHGRLIQRIKNIIRLFRIAASYDFIIAVGCAYYGFLPILSGVLAARVYRKRILIDFHEDSDHFISRFGKVLKLIVGNMPVTVATDYIKSLLDPYRINTFFIPHHFHYQDFPKREKPFAWNKKFIWVGSFEPSYDPETALKACQLALKQKDNLEFHFFGRGPLLGQLKKRYGHPKILFRGFVPRTKLLEEYQDFSVLVNTSLRDNFPLRFVEASFNDLLVISSRSGGIPEIYNDQECLFFEKRDYKRLAEYIIAIINNPQGYDSFRINMHRKVSDFTWDKVRTSWLNLLKN